MMNSKTFLLTSTTLPLDSLVMMIELEIQFHSNSCSYLNCDDFNSIISKTPTNFSVFHLNIASMPKHFDELRTLLAQLDCKFSFIGISETRNSTVHAPELVHEYCIPGYNKFFTPTESSAGGVSLYVSDIFPSVPRNDLNHSCYLANNLESTFVEVNLPNRTNICIVIHVCL